jgi:hypothetical protein
MRLAGIRTRRLRILLLFSGAMSGRTARYNRIRDGRIASNLSSVSEVA